LGIEVLGDPPDLFGVFINDKDILVFFRKPLGNMVTYLAGSHDDDLHELTPGEFYVVSVLLTNKAKLI
jgi:hypothetical protein